MDYKFPENCRKKAQENKNFSNFFQFKEFLDEYPAKTIIEPRNNELKHQISSVKVCAFICSFSSIFG